MRVRYDDRFQTAFADENPVDRYADDAVLCIVPVYESPDHAQMLPAGHWLDA